MGFSTDSLYGISVALACSRVAMHLRTRSNIAALTGTCLAWLVIAAALLDAVENYGLIRLLLGSSGAGWPAVIQWLAAVKFTLVGLGLVYLVVGTGVLVAPRLLQKEQGDGQRRK